TRCCLEPLNSAASAVIHGTVYREVTQALVRDPHERGYMLFSIEGAGLLFRDVANVDGKIGVALDILPCPVIVPCALGDAVLRRTTAVGWVLGVGGAFAANDVVDD